MTRRMREITVWAVWTLLLLILAAVFSAPAFPEVYGVRPQLILSAGVSAAVLEPKGVRACGYTVLAGLLMDTVQGSLFGFYGLMMLFFGALIVWLMENVLRAGSFHAGCLAAGVSFLCGCAGAEVSLMIWGYADGAVGKVLLALLIRAVYTGILTVPVCFLMKKAREWILGKEKKEYRFSEKALYADEEEKEN